MCSNAKELEIGAPDGVASALPSEDSNPVDTNIDGNPGALKRNVLTQHGDYRSVDEENIVILKNCPSPQPSTETDGADGEQSGNEPQTQDDTQPSTSRCAVDEQVVWIEPFADDDSEVSFL